MPFFSPFPKCAAYSDSSYCGAHKWLSEQKGMQKERVGSEFKRKAPIGAPFLLSNLLRDKKSYSLVLEGEERHYRTAVLVSDHQFFHGAADKVPVLTLLHTQLPAPALIAAHSAFKRFHQGAPVSLLTIYLHQIYFHENNRCEYRKYMSVETPVTFLKYFIAFSYYVADYNIQFD
ncbi:hypothetical protein ILYODFUR_011712 [Ilyodon furcidens]|uniref:Uncharacterized protein n=1 Tax=Ilyodon furcidens TaxID=33524 RepID=A0ABV0SZ95_9TELE